MMKRIILAAFALQLSMLPLPGCSNNAEDPEEQAYTLQPYPVHTLPLGVQLDSLQQILRGHSALFHPVVEGRMYRIIPLNAYGNVGFGAVEIDSTKKVKSYYWYTNLENLTAEQRRYYTQEPHAVKLDSVIAGVRKDLGEPKTFKPYPKEEWYTWQRDTAQLNLTLQNKHITFTKTAPVQVALETDTTEEVVVSPVAKPKPMAKKPAPKKKTVAKKAPVKKAPAKKAPAKRTTTKRTTRR
jgi:outer membrane protein assembly factor BamE (lipoprotein component of BamABCDE complex)